MDQTNKNIIEDEMIKGCALLKRSRKSFACSYFSIIFFFLQNKKIFCLNEIFYRSLELPVIFRNAFTVGLIPFEIFDQFRVWNICFTSEKEILPNTFFAGTLGFNLKFVGCSPLFVMAACCHT